MTTGLIDFDGCGDADRNLAFWSGSFISTSTSYGVFGGYGIQVLSGGNARRNITATSHPIIGYHLNVRIWNNASTGPELHLREGTTVHAKLKFNEGGAIQVLGAAGTVLDTIPAETWQFQSWGYIEVDLTVANSGNLKVHVFGDPTEIISVSGDFQNGGTGVVDNVYWTGGSGNTHWIDDFYQLDGTVGGTVTLNGCRVGLRQPNSDDTAEFTRSTGATNYGTVDELPFSATDYNETDVDGEKDLYGVTDDGVDFQVFGVRVIGQMKKSDASAAKGRLIIDDSGNQGDGVTRTLSATSTVYADVFAERPSGAGEWDETSVDGLLIGVERIAA